MSPHDFLLQMMIILVAARIFAELATRLATPPVIGELLAGIVVGPSLFGVLAPDDTIKLLAEIGILLLLFEVGLETDMAKLARTGLKSFLVALLGFLAPLVLGVALALCVFRMELVPALFVGGTLTATSIGITVRVLQDLNRQKDKEAQIVLGAAVMDDVMGVILLALLYDFSSGAGVSVAGTSRVIFFIVAFMVVAPIVASALSSLVERADERGPLPGLLPTMMISLILLCAWSAHKIGAPELLGGFAAGIAVSRYFYLPFAPQLRSAEGFARRVEHEMRPIVHLFTPIFFVMVGLSLNLREVDWSSPFVWLLSGALALVAFLGKIGAGFCMTRESNLSRWAVGLAMVPRGEVGLIFAELGRSRGIFNQDVYAAMLIVIALTTVIPPFVLRWFYNGPGRKLGSG
jgi:Kef-type K+ transport system membrane component KefB